MKRATERREPAVRTWLQREYPAIAARAETEDAQIQWADETGLSNQANYGRSFAPKGPTPIIRRPAARFSHSMISSLTNQGKLRFMVYERALDMAIFLRFLRRLVTGARRKLFLIVDNLRGSSRQARHRLGAGPQQADRTGLLAALRARAQSR